MTEVGKVIVGYDGSERGQDALALGVALATVTRATLIVARAFAGPPLRAELATVASSIEGVDVEPCALSGDSPAKALYGLAVESPDAIVVLGSSHRGGFGQVMPGSVVEPMLHGSPRPVAVAPRGLARSDYSLRVLGAAFDDSAEARIALELAGELALRAAATVRVIGVLNASAPDAAGGQVQQAASVARAGFRDAIHDAAAGLPNEVRALPVVCHGNPVPELLSQCEQGIDLLVMGSRGYGPLRSVLLGSTSSMMIRAARCPVIVVPRPRK